MVHARGFAFLIIVGLVGLGCGSITPGDGDDSGVADDAAVDGGPDGGPDAPLRGPGGQSLGAGANRLIGATFVFDVQLGHGGAHPPLRGATYQLAGNSPVAP